MTPEQKARVSIDALLIAAGWHVCNVADANIHAGNGAAKGVANRVHNLLRQLADAGHIQNVGGRRWPKWVPGNQ